MHIFHQVVQAGSFSKAALRLRQPKSRISRNIAALERELGVQLIYRTTRQFRLTDAGRALFEWAEAPLNDLAHALEAVTQSSDELAGPLRVTAPEDLGVTLLADICRAFQEIHPKVHIELCLTGDVLDLVKDSLDVAVRIGQLRDSSLLQKKIGIVRLGLYAAPALAGPGHAHEDFRDVEALPFLRFSGKRGGGRFELQRGDERAEFHPRAVFTANSHVALRALAVQGLGVALLPGFLVQDDLRRGRLRALLPEWGSSDVPIQVVIPQQKEPLPRVRRFMDFVARELGPYFA